MITPTGGQEQQTMNQAAEPFTTMEPASVTYKILEKATGGFSKECEIGRGASGVVYKGTMPNGDLVAVKKLYEDHPKHDDDRFIKEFENLKKVNHPNIVRIIGYCYETDKVLEDYKGQTSCFTKTYRLLCFEYLPKLSLKSYLSDYLPKLDWPTCYKVIWGICQGLKHIHLELQPPMRHMDIKPANVLLDANMNAKLADFGLATVFVDEATVSTLTPYGTYGYRPPEFYKRQRSKSFDIFSLGVVILQLVTGYKGYSKMDDKPREKFIDEAQQKWRDQLSENYKDSLLEVYCKQVKVCIEIGSNCVEVERQKRPKIAVIINQMLETENGIPLSNMGQENENLSQTRIDSKKAMTSESDPALSSEHLNMRMVPSSSFGRLPPSPMGRHHHLEKILQGERWEPCNLPLQMLRDITNNFSEEQELGRGGFGVVCKGVLQNGHVIAVKKFFSLTGIAEKHFENEINHLMTLEHNNIVRCVGYCYHLQKKCIKVDGRYHFVEDSEMLLCLEYMPEGSLEKYISDGYCGLDWQVRYKIIVGICHGLYYLHDNRTLHLDIKPANILLNYDMEPKITDFGLSRLLDPEQSLIYTKEYVGTLGYMAPEYLDKGLISVKSDVFSIGVVIIEIIVGNMDYPHGTGTSTQDFVEQVLQNWRNRLVELRSTSLEKYSQQIKVCIEIGLSCVHPDAVKRPTIREIIEWLNRCDNTNFRVSNEERTPADMVHKKQANLPKGAQYISSLENRRGMKRRRVKTGPNDIKKLSPVLMETSISQFQKCQADPNDIKKLSPVLMETSISQFQKCHIL